MRKSLRFALFGAAAAALVACTALLGVDDLPPATDGAGADSSTSDVTTPNGGPTHLASSLTWVDQDPAKDSAQGHVTIGRAADESDIDTYNLYWGNSSAQKLPGASSNVVVVVPKSKAQLVADMPPAPSGATYVLVYTANGRAEMTTPVAALVVDNYPTFFQFPGAPVGDGFYPSVAIDEPSHTLVFATQTDTAATGLDAGVSTAALFVSSLDDGGTSERPLIGGGNGQTPSLVIDPTSHKALVVVRESDRPGLFVSSLDGATAVHHDAYGSGPVGSGVTPIAFLDSARTQLDIVAEDDDAGMALSFFAYDLTENVATFTNLTSKAQPTPPSKSGQRPAAVYDDLDGVNGPRMVVATKTASGPGLYDCKPDGTICRFTDLTSKLPTMGNGKGTALVLDRVNAKIDFVVDDSSGSYTVLRCDATGIHVGDTCGATRTALSQAPNTDMRVSAVIDDVTGKLWIAYAIKAGAYPAVARCESDGSSCVVIDLALTGATGCGTNPAVVIDRATRRLLVVTDNAADGDRPALFTLGLW